MTSVSTDETATKGRKVRKGTKSCVECRRRKVKCKFASPNNTICDTCHRRGAKCISQVIWDELAMAENHAVGPRRHVAINTGLVSKSTSQADVVAGCSSTTSPVIKATQALPAHNKDTTSPLRPGKAPNLSTTSKLPPAPTPNHAYSPENVAFSDITDALLRSLPSERDIGILLENLSGMSMFCYQSSFKLCSSWPIDIVKEKPLAANLLHPSRHPVLLARQMLFFAVGLQYLSPEKAILGLSTHQRAIVEHLVDSVIRLVNSNDLLLGTLEGLENIILEGFYHMDGGNLRRSWITMRRAVMAAQLLGLHRPGHYRFKTVEQNNDIDPATMWACAVSTEQYLSLLLGLSTSAGGVTLSIPRGTNSFVENGKMPALITGIVCKIIDRNQAHIPQKALEMTQNIDAELLRVSEQWPPTFWQPLNLAGLEVDSADAFWEIRRAWDHMFFYSLVNQVHLPCMLNPTLISHSLYSRIACASASREVLGRHIAIRTFNPVTAGCRMGDFVALISGMTLTLAHILGHCNKDSQNLLAHQRVGDRAIVERALECVGSMPGLHEDALAAKWVALVRNFLDIEARSASMNLNHNPSDDQDILIVKVPHVGAIRITRNNISMAPFDSEQEQVSPDNLTIGGFGSIHVKISRDSSHLPGRTSEYNSPRPIAHVVTVSSPGQQCRQPAQPTFGGILAMPKDLLDEASDGVQDWLSQSFDTAFFDVLMSGNDEESSNGISTERWH